MKNYSHITEYKQALRIECWAFFYMRGAEGFLSDRHESPVYLNNVKAQTWWKLGHDAMRDFLKLNKDRFFSWDLGLFCSAFLRGSAITDHQCENVAIVLRMGFEAQATSKVSIFEKEREMNTNTLYKVIDQEVYGNKVGTNSKGEVILELRGEGGKVRGYKPEELEEVKPYTVSIRMNGNLLHYIAMAGDYKEGDIVIICSTNQYFQLGLVEKVNTKTDTTAEASKFIIGTVSLVKKNETPKEIN